MPPLTGVVRIYGPEITLAGQVAAMEVNESGGVLGRPLHLVIEDDGSMPHSAVRAAEKLLDQHGCVALIGNLLSNSRIAVTYRVAEPRKIPLLNFSFYEGSILSRYFFHFAALPNQQIEKMIPYMKEKYGPCMYFAGNNYEWPRGSIGVAQQVLLHAKGKVVGEEYFSIGVAREQIDSLLQQVAQSGADVFVPYFAGADQVLLLTRFAEMGLKSRMAVVMGHYDEMMASQLPSDVRDGHYSSNTYFMTVATEKNREFLARLAAMPGITGLWPQGNGILTNFGEGTYLCVKAFAQAANKAGSLDPEALVDALETLSISGPQGVVSMDPETHHAKVNTFLSRCNAAGEFSIVESFGSIDPKIPERYSHLQINARAVREEDVRLQARIIEHMTEGVCLVRAEDGIIVFVNRGFEKMLACEKGEIMGKPISLIYAATDRTPRQIADEIMAHLFKKGVWEGDVLHVRKNGTPFWGHVSISTMTHAEHGEIWIGLHQDISARKLAEEQLRQYRDNLEETVRTRTEELDLACHAAEAAARAKENFLVTMSHEIRTPMNGVLGMADLILKTSLTERQRHYAETIHRSGHTLLRIINDILDFSKIQDGRFSPDILRFDLDVVIQDLCAMFLSRTRHSNLDFQCKMADGLPLHLLGDPHRLSQILYNLVGNAVKFTEKGSVTLAVDSMEERDVDVLLRFQIADTGIGISPEYQQHLFQTFSQEDSSITRRFGGTGLGLAITRKLVRLLDGNLWMESVPGQGSTFRFTVRFGKQQPGDQREFFTWSQKKPDASNLTRFEGHILLVEDNLVNQDVALETLKLLGCQVTVAGHGQHALTLIREAVLSFDAVFMDCEMPILDGFETTRRLRAWEKQTGSLHTPVIALTAHVLPESRQRCRDAGMDDYLQKPFSQADMETILQRWLPGPARAPLSPDPGHNPDQAALPSTPPKSSPLSPDPGYNPVPASFSPASPVQNPASEHVLSLVPVLDRIAVDRILELARKGGTGLLGRMVEHYLVRTPKLLEELADALENNNSDAVRIAAHTLKSSSLTMGAARLAELGRTMEAGHVDLVKVREYFRLSGPIYAEVKQALRDLCSLE
ncbi:MAG: ABC transporter substrate-binding protein [Magnetococcus sp. DMHC-1]